MFSVKNYISGWLEGKLRKKGPLGPYSALKIALISDALTQVSLEVECQVKYVTPFNYQRIFEEWRPDLLFVESAWQGYGDTWKYKIANYPAHPDRTNHALKQVVEGARDANIPAIFWNKEDSVHYERFVNSAGLFDYIFTVDENCVPAYKRDIPSAAVVDSLMFPVQPRFHYPDVSADERLGFSCFVGSYGTHVHPQRRRWQDMLFQVFAPAGLDIYDRNSSRKATHYRYPIISGMRIRSKVPYPKTARLYRSYKFNLNVNTVEDSPTMYSRRLIEILAAGGVAISTPSLAATRLFSNYCHIADSLEGFQEVVDWSAEEYGRAVQRARAGAEIVLREHVWAKRLEKFEKLNIF